MIGPNAAISERRGRRALAGIVVAGMLVGAPLVGAVRAEPTASPAPSSADGGAVSADEAKAVAEKRRTENESAAPASGGAGAQKLGKGPHGAMPVVEQLARVDDLKLATEPAIPRGFDPVVWEALVPKDNAVTAERIALGKKLFFDTRLSKDGTLACATCHDASRSFTDRRPVSEGIADQLGQRNAPTTMNALFFQTQFLDGRAPSLEEQAKLPIVNPIEMGQPNADATIANIVDDTEYQRMFQAAYGRPVNFDDLAGAIATFERTMVFLDAPFDDFAAGDQSAISARAQEGWVLFNGKARCVSCHMLSQATPLGSDDRFHNIGVSARKQNFEELADKALQALHGKRDREGMEAVDRLAIETNLSELGRFLVTKNRSDIGSFKTSQLRNVGITGPYMHDGSMQTLFDVMDHYNRGGEANPFLDGGIEPLALEEDEIAAVVEFLGTLTDKRFAAEQRAETDRQRAVAAERRPFRETNLAMRKVLPFEQRVAGKAAAPTPAPPDAGRQSGQEGAR